MSPELEAARQRIAELEAQVLEQATLLKQLEANIHPQLEATLDGYILADTDGWLQAVNASYCEMIGYTREELLQMNIRQLEVKIPQEEIDRRIEQMVAQGRDRFETQHRTKDGRILDLDVSIVIIHQKNRPLVAAFVRDITEYKRALRDLQQHALLLDTAQQLAHLGIWTWHIPTDTITWTEEIDRIFGLNGKITQTTLAGYLRSVHPEDKERIAHLLEQCRTTKTAVVFDERIIRPDGQIRYLRSWANMLPGPDNTYNTMIGACMDMTDHVLAESRLQESEKRYRRLFEDVPVALWEEDFSGVKQYIDELKAKGITDFRAWFENNPDAIQHCARLIQIRNINQAAVAMYEADNKQQLLGNLAGLITEATQNAFKEELIALASGRTRFHTEFVSHTLKGNKVYVELTLAIAPGYEDTWATVILATNDITARKETETQIRRLNEELEQRVKARTAELNQRIDEVERLNRGMINLLEDIQAANHLLTVTTRQLEATNKELEAFAYSVSHDLRAPLRAIDGFSRILLDQFANELPAEAQRLLNLVRNNSQQMGQLIDDLLSFSRQGRQPLHKEMVKPQQIVETVWQELAPERNGRQIELILGDLPPCYADPALLKQVYVNLITNALKFTRQKTIARIEIGCKQQDNQLIYFVKDNGAGFDMRYANKLFGVFQRLHRAEEYEGTGVGLAIVKRIIVRHGGQVWAEAEPEKGATFYFTLEPGGTTHEQRGRDFIGRGQSQ